MYNVEGLAAAIVWRAYEDLLYDLENLLAYSSGEMNDNIKERLLVHAHSWQTPATITKYARREIKEIGNWFLDDKGYAALGFEYPPEKYIYQAVKVANKWAGRNMTFKQIMGIKV